MSSLQKIAFTLMVCLFAVVCIGGVIAAENGACSSAAGNTGKPHGYTDGQVFSPDPTRVAYTGIPVSSPPEPANLTVNKTALGSSTSVPIFWDASRNCSPDRRHCASVFPTEEGQCMMLDGNMGKSYKRIGGQVFSPDSKHIGYIVESGGKRFVVVDDKEGKQYDDIGKETLVFSPDSSRVAYTGVSAAAGTECCVVADGVEGKWYPAADKPIFSPDSKHVAYYTGSEYGKTMTGPKMVSGKGVIVVDDKEVRQFDEVGDLVFSPDSAHWACIIMVGKQYLVVQDGVDGKPYDWIMGPPIFSPDSKHMAYIAGSEGKRFVVQDGVEGNGYDVIIAGGFGAPVNQTDVMPVFSPDSQHLAYVAKDGDKYLIVQDAVEGKKYSKKVSRPVFSPDSKHLAYGATDADGACIVQDGVEGPKYSDISRVTFSPDSSRLAYAAVIKYGEECVMVDGVEGTHYFAIGDIVQTTPNGQATGVGIVFTPDSKRIICAGKTQGGKCFIIIDGVTGKEYERVLDLNISPDGKHVAYRALLGGLWVYVIDGQEIGEPEEKPVTGLIFDSPTKCHGIIQKGSTAFLIEIEIAP